MTAKFLNIYVLRDGKIETGETRDTVRDAIKAAMQVDCISFVTAMLIVQNGIITTAAIARKE